MLVQYPNDSVLRNRLVASLIEARKISTSRIADAFRIVPRHLFVPHVEPEDAYRDEAIFTKSSNGVSLSASSAPSIMAEMLELLQVETGHRVLEIGAGTGYNAALLEELVGPSGHVVTIDIDSEIVDAAKAGLAAAGRGRRIRVRLGDGGHGWQDDAPYDRIIVTVGAWDLTPAWQDQLVPGGRLVVPLEFRDVHKLVTFERCNDRLVSVDVRDCRFVQMRGAFAGPERQIPLRAGLYLSTMSEGVQADQMRATLDASSADEEMLALPLSPEELYGAFRLWLALRTDDFCLLSLEGMVLHQSRQQAWYTTPERSVVAPSPNAEFASIPGLLSEEGICLIERNERNPRLPMLRVYGTTLDLARRVQSYLKEWDSVGRPFSAGLSIEATRIPSSNLLAADQPGFLIDKRWFRYRLRPLSNPDPRA